MRYKKKAPLYNGAFFNLILALPNFPGRYQPSIFGAVDFTTVFGMGTGVSPQLYTPEIFYFYLINIYILTDNQKFFYIKLKVKYNFIVIFEIYVLMNAE